MGRKMRTLQKIAYTISGAVLATILYSLSGPYLVYALATVFSLSIENAGIADHYIIRSIYVGTASILHGYFINHVESNEFRKQMIYNPGIFFTAIYILMNIDTAYALKYRYFLEALQGVSICAIIWLTASGIGMYCGYRLLGKK